MVGSEQPIGYRFGAFVLDLEWGGLIAADGKEIPLRPKSFALLRLLVENAGRVLSRDTIMTALWSDLFVTENNVTQCIHDIRRALGSEATQILHTLSRRGYRFTSNVIAIPRGNPLVQKTSILERGANYFMPVNATTHRKDELRF